LVKGEFSIGGILEPNHALEYLISLAALLLLAWGVSWLLSRLMRRSNWVMGKLGRKVDETIIRYAIQVKNVLIFSAAVLYWSSYIPGLNKVLNTVLAGAGITALVFGFAAKSTLANLVAGLSLAIYRPIRIGDKVSLENDYGTVEDITLRHTIVRTWENKRLVIPNEKLDNMTVTNHSIIEPRILCRVEMGVSYDTDIDLARRLILEEAARCPHKMDDELAPEPPYVRVIDLADFSIVLRTYVWTENMDHSWQTRFWLLEMVKKRFDAEGVEIPFPYRTLVYKKDLPPARREAKPPEGGDPISSGK
jgi:small conductance mechanosensitive channel